MENLIYKLLLLIGRVTNCLVVRNIITLKKCNIANKGARVCSGVSIREILVGKAIFL